MVLAEVLTGLALVKSAVSGIKSAINTTNDISAIAGHVDKLLQGRDEANKAKRDAASDPFSVKSIAEETINAKLAEEHLDEMRNLIDMRFGHGTWQGIINERSKRIREAADAEKKAKLAADKRMEQILEALAVIGVVVGMSLFFVGMIWISMRG
jgi:hypothetical protein